MVFPHKKVFTMLFPLLPWWPYLKARLLLLEHTHARMHAHALNFRMARATQVGACWVTTMHLEHEGVATNSSAQKTLQVIWKFESSCCKCSWQPTCSHKLFWKDVSWLMSVFDLQEFSPWNKYKNVRIFLLLNYSWQSCTCLNIMLKT